MVVWCGMVWWFFLTDNDTTPTKIILHGFGLLFGLWQYITLYTRHPALPL
jgi:hypothetical protein